MAYPSLYARLVANSELAVPDNPQSCWLWKGHAGDHYPKLCVKRDGQPRNIYAHRTMMEEVLDCVFPFDEAGHLCCNPRCINPDHLEVQTRWHNMAEQRAQFGGGKGRDIHHDERSWIPVLFPREECHARI